MIKVRFVFDNDTTEYTMPVKKKDTTPIKVIIDNYLKTLNIEYLNELDEEKKKTFLLLKKEAKQYEFVLKMEKLIEYYPKYVFTMKCGTLYAQEWVRLINQSIIDITSSNNETKDYRFIGNILASLFEADIFAEEFIVFGGVKNLVDFIVLVQGTAKSEGVRALSVLYKLKNAIEYLLENYDVYETLFKIFADCADDIRKKVGNEKVLHHLPKVFIHAITNAEDKENVANAFYNTAKKYAQENGSQIFKEIMNLLNIDQAQQSRKIFVKLIAVVSQNLRKNKLSAFVSDLNEAGFKDLIEEQIKGKTTQLPKFYKYLKAYEQATNEVMSGGSYQLELYKKKKREIRNIL